MDKSNVMVEFTIYADEFPIDEITKTLGIVPTLTYIKGDQIRDTIMSRKNTCWEISTDYEDSYDINDQLNKIIRMLKPKKKFLLELKKKYKLGYKFCIVINIYDGKKPAIYFEYETISFITDIKAYIDTDLYIYSLQEEDEED